LHAPFSHSRTFQRSNNVMSAAPGTLCVGGFKHDKANRRDVSTVDVRIWHQEEKLKCARSLELQRL
jgi:hypothetical protein